MRGSLALPRCDKLLYMRDPTSPNAAMRLLQGYLWHPQGSDWRIADALPATLTKNIYLLWDEVRPPFTFFDDGTLSSSQVFYQLTVLYLEKHSVQEATPQLWQERAQYASDALAPYLESSPAEVGWQLLGDLRPL